MKNISGFPREVYLNGDWLPAEAARISVFDRAFMFGDGVYEVTAFYKGSAFLLQAHLSRLQYSLDELRIDFRAETLKEVMATAVKKAALNQEFAAVYIQVTRGTAPRSHRFPANTKPNVLVYAFKANLENFWDKQWNVVVSADLRWQRCDIKSTAILANTMANEAALSEGFDENILVREKIFTEGSHSSIFFWIDGVLYTHPENSFILSGITRNLVIKRCSVLGIEVKEKAIRHDQLAEVDEIFVTGTTTQITAVRSVKDLEGKRHHFKHGELTALLQKDFRELVGL